MSDLMADFFGALATRDVAIEWARRTLAAGDAGEIAEGNALRVLRRLGAEARRGLDLSGRDLRGQDLSGRDLEGARLDGADLTDARLVRARLKGASLRGARLVRADLSGADAVLASFEEADLTLARLLGAELLGARFGGAQLLATSLTGARGLYITALGQHTPDGALPFQQTIGIGLQSSFADSSLPCGGICSWRRAVRHGAPRRDGESLGDKLLQAAPLARGAHRRGMERGLQPRRADAPLWKRGWDGEDLESKLGRARRHTSGT
ncbi:MAG: pentapeptide repeat-containing protein [Polyangiaceae bacterium]|nr:pentapeptide repeat-containing protein [Polyangiaceae bacterium]